MKKISVIVPVYNLEKYVRKCIDSLVNQTLQDIEIILVNDGSTDTSQSILDKYARKYSNIKIISKKNEGLASARNSGLKKATGKYISFVDGDDYLDKDTFEKLYNFAEKKEADIVCYNLKYIYPDGNQTIMYGGKTEKVTCEEYLIGTGSACSKIFRKDLLDKASFSFPVGITSEDAAVIPSLIIYTDKIYYLKDCDYNYIQRQGSISNKEKYNKNSIQAYKSIIYLKEIFKKNNCYEKYKDELEYLFIENCLITIPLKNYNFKEGINDIKETSKFMKDNYPKWKNNKYFKQMSKKEKVYASLFYKNKINTVKLLYNVKNKIKGVLKHE